MKKNNFYPELWVGIFGFGVVFVFMAGCTVLFLIGPIMILLREGSGGIGIAGASFLFFLIPSFLCARLLFSFLKSRYVSMCSLSVHDRDIIKKAKIICYEPLVSGIVAPRFSKAELLLEGSSEPLWLTVKATYMMMVGLPPIDGEVIEGEAFERDGKPYMFRKTGIRIWLIAAADDDQPSTPIGRFFSKMENKVDKARPRGKFS